MLVSHYWSISVHDQGKEVRMQCYGHFDSKGHQLLLKPCGRDFHKEGFTAKSTARTCPGGLYPVLFYYDLHFMCLCHKPLFGQTIIYDLPEEKIFIQIREGLLISQRGFDGTHIQKKTEERKHTLCALHFTIHSTIDNV